MSRGRSHTFGNDAFRQCRLRNFLSVEAILCTLMLVTAFAKGVMTQIESRAKCPIKQWLSLIYLLYACFHLQGHALALGAILLLVGDVCIAREDRAKIGLNEVQIGMTAPILAVELARLRLSPRFFLKATITGYLTSMSHRRDTAYQYTMSTGIVSRPDTFILTNSISFVVVKVNGGYQFF